MCWRLKRDGNNTSMVESSQYLEENMISHRIDANSHHPITEISKRGSVQSGNKQPFLNNDTAYVCRWRFCLLLCFSIFIIVVAVIILLLYCVAVPSFAQSVVNHSTMDIVSGTMYNPTTDSVELSSTIHLFNAGMFAATMHAHRAELWSDGYPMGYIQLSDIHIEPKSPAIIPLNTTLMITNASLFQDSCRNLLKGIDQMWQLKTTHQKVSATIGGITFTTHVHLNKGLLLPGASMLDLQTSNVRVTNATESTITAIADIRFRTNSILSFDLPPSQFDIYINGEWIANAPLTDTSIHSGLNSINDTTLIITKTNTNEAVLQQFFSTFISGDTQFATLSGPNGRLDGSALVIDGVLQQYVSVVGNTVPLISGGIMTSVTQAGWKDKNGNTVRGAYADAYNSFDVPLRVTNISANINMKIPVRFNMTLAHLFHYNCYPQYTTGLAYVTLGSGTWKHNLAQTWVDMPPKTRVSVFVHAYPQEDQKGPNCMSLFPFPCCWAGITPAAICQMNSQLRSDINDQITYAHIPAELDGNFTALVGNKFEITIQHHEDFFPCYFGYQVYAGTFSDGEINCKSFRFY